MERRLADRVETVAAVAVEPEASRLAKVHVDARVPLVGLAAEPFGEAHRRVGRVPPKTPLRVRVHARCPVRLTVQICR